MVNLLFNRTLNRPFVERLFYNSNSGLFNLRFKSFSRPKESLNTLAILGKRGEDKFAKIIARKSAFK